MNKSTLTTLVAAITTAAIAVATNLCQGPDIKTENSVSALRFFQGEETTLSVMGNDIWTAPIPHDVEKLYINNSVWAVGSRLSNDERRVFWVDPSGQLTWSEGFALGPPEAFHFYPPWITKIEVDASNKVVWLLVNLSLSRKSMPEVWSLDLSSGELLSKFELPSDSPPDSKLIGHDLIVCCESEAILVVAVELSATGKTRYVSTAIEAKVLLAR